MNILIGPFLGEFGWEVMVWQGAVRYYLQDRLFDKIVVGCRKGNEALYELATDFIYPEKISLNTQAMCVDGRIPKFSEKTIKEFSPCIVRNVKEIPQLQLHRKFGEYDTNLKYDILIHARDSHKYSTAKRNWLKDNWDMYVSEFKGLRIGSIGTETESLHLEGVEDLRGYPLSILFNILASSSVLVGPSSGAMHLGSLCCIPLVVWANKAITHIGCTTRKRYEKDWNPFESKVTVIDKYGWNPPVEDIISATKEYL